MSTGNNPIGWVEYAERNWWNPADLLPPIQLSEHVSDILEVLQRAEAGGDDARVWQEIDRVRSKYITMARFDAGVALHECALAALRLKNFSVSRELFYDARDNLSRGDSHHYAIATWMLGCVYWLEKDSQHNKGIDAWQETIDIFERQANNASTNTFKMRWYHRTMAVMVDLLESAIRGDGLPPVEDIFGVDVSDSGLENSTDSQKEETPAKLEFPIRVDNFFELFAVFETIPAGMAGALDYVPSAKHPVHPGLDPDDLVEVSRVRIGEQEYVVQSLRRGERKVNLAQESEHFALRVKGTSMNMAGIDDGDLVVCRAQNYATHMDIAALVFDLTKFSEGDEILASLGKLLGEEGVDNKLPATLKRYIEQVDEISIKAESTTPLFDDFMFSFPKSALADSDEIRIYGVAVAVLKPV